MMKESVLSQVQCKDIFCHHSLKTGLKGLAHTVNQQREIKAYGLGFFCWHKGLYHIVDKEILNKSKRKLLEIAHLTVTGSIPIPLLQLSIFV